MVRAGGIGAKSMLAAAVAVTACACSSKQPKIEENIFPADYKAQIVRHLRMQSDYRLNLRDAYVAPPLMKAYQSTARYISCIRFTAQDDSKEMAAFFFSGGLTQVVNAPPELCANAAYEPFPELQKL
jgi:hypothetical protein